MYNPSIAKFITLYIKQKITYLQIYRDLCFILISETTHISSDKGT